MILLVIMYMVTEAWIPRSSSSVLVVEIASTDKKIKRKARVDLFLSSCSRWRDKGSREAQLSLGMSALEAML